MLNLTCEIVGTLRIIQNVIITFDNLAKRGISWVSYSNLCGHSLECSLLEIFGIDLMNSQLQGQS